MNTVSHWTPNRYRFDLSGPDAVAAVARAVFPAVWRTTTAEPGFAVVRLRGACGSREMRAVMRGLADGFGFVPERLGRFDQQVTSRFHRDGAPDASLLLLGYEPSRVRSRVFVADAHAAANAAGLALIDYLRAHSPVLPAGEAKISPWVTEVAPHGEAFILILNNCFLPENGENPLGVLHKAQILEPDPAATRVINSMGLMLEEEASRGPKTAAEIEHFLTRDDLD